MVIHSSKLMFLPLKICISLKIVPSHVSLTSHLSLKLFLTVNSVDYSILSLTCHLIGFDSVLAVVSVE